MVVPAEPSLFRGTGGKYITKGLFKQFGNPDAPYDMKDMRQAYLDCDDPTEYKFAVTYFESWAHFKHLCELNWFSGPLQQWRDELAVRIMAEGLSTIVEEVRSEGRGRVTCAKYLVEKGWMDKGDTSSTKRGRPTKEEVRGAIKQAAGITQEVEEDFNRIFN